MALSGMGTESPGFSRLISLLQQYKHLQDATYFVIDIPGLNLSFVRKDSRIVSVMRKNAELLFPGSQERRKLDEGADFEGYYIVETDTVLAVKKQLEERRRHP